MQSGQRVHVDVITFTGPTSRSAKKCDGTALNDELVIEYEHKSTDQRWTVKARTRTLCEPFSPVFDYNQAVVDSGNRRSFEDRVGRALVAPWSPPVEPQSDGPRPTGARQSLWIDIVSTLPLLWSVSVPAGRSGAHRPCWTTACRSHMTHRWICGRPMSRCRATACPKRVRQAHLCQPADLSVYHSVVRIAEQIATSRSNPTL